MKLKRILIIAAAALLLLVAALVAVYPVLSNYLNDKYQSVVRTDYEAEIRELDDTAIREAQAAAEAYNASLAPVHLIRESITAASVEYDAVLNLSGSGLMGYVVVPQLGIDLPIYHGTSEEVLQKGVGHLVGTSLPIGGEGCHSVLTGHSGVAGKKLFSDLDQLQVGDVFYLHVLDKTLAYQVTEINKVLPHEVELLEPVAGEDLCTLVTCTPIGVNTHRLYVRSSRIPFEEAEEIIELAAATEEPKKSTWMEQYIFGLLLGGVIIVLAVVAVVVVMLLRHRKRQEDQDEET
ncbi:MAG: class C sortase [Oscillospiraceae bacterium]|nr:class C sortase [Oscillospiraceae bacterium]